MPNPNYQPRLVINIPKELRERLFKGVPHGNVGRIVRGFLLELTEKAEKDPTLVPTLLIQGFGFTDVVVKEAKEDGDTERPTDEHTEASSRGSSSARKSRKGKQKRLAKASAPESERTGASSSESAEADSESTEGAS